MKFPPAAANSSTILWDIASSHPQSGVPKVIVPRQILETSSPELPK